MLKTVDLDYTYPDGTQALEKVSIKLPKEHILGILGKSGSGKTTLLKCIGRFLEPQFGKVLLHDENIYTMYEKKLRQSIGIVFQNLYLFPHLTVLENMTLALTKVLGKDEKEANQESMKTLERLGIEEIYDNYPSQISGGQAQRVAIARGLVLKPEYLLLDEPTAALDINTADEFGRWLLDLKEETTFVIVTHDVLFVRKIATEGVLIEEGKVLATGKIEKIIDSLNIKIDDLDKYS